MAVFRFIRMPELRVKVGKSASTIYAEIRAGTFPKGFKIGRQSVAWSEKEIEAWQREKIAERDADSNKAARKRQP